MTDHPRSELAAAARALRERWPIGEALRAELIQSALSVLTHPESSRREQLASIRVLLAMDRLSIEQLKLAAEGADDLDARLALAERRADDLDGEGGADPQAPPVVPA